MSNQYSKIELTVEFKLPQDTLLLKKQYTKALFELLKTKIPQNTMLIDEIIKTIKQELN